MRFPWRESDDGDEAIQELERRIEELQEERDSFRKRFEAEKERRSKVSREKQDAEERINRLEDRIEGLKSDSSDDEKKEEYMEVEAMDVKQVYSLLLKLESMKSGDRDCVTIYSSEGISGLEDLKGLRNTMATDQFNFLQGEKSFIAFTDQKLVDLVLKTRPFFDSSWSLSDSFKVSNLKKFIDTEKIWVLVSAGNSTIYRESSGQYEKLEEVKSRVDRKHSKGGFSQDRFERKREEQVAQHLEDLEERIPDEDEVYLLGDRKLCKDLTGEYLGGFDPNTAPPKVFYNFRKVEK